MKTVNLFIKLICLCFFLVFSRYVGYSQVEGWQNLTGINTIQEIVDDHPYLWLATDGGLLKLNKATGEIEKYTRANGDLPGNRLGAIAVQNNLVWMGTRYEGIGLGKFDGKHCSIYNPNNSGIKRFGTHTALAVDSSEQLWIGELFDITLYNGSQFTSYNCPINPIMSNTNVFQILTFNNIVYVSGTWNIAGIQSHEDNSNLKFINAGFGMVCDNEGKLYYSLGNGLTVYNNGTWNNYTTANSKIPTNKLGIGSKDTDGNIWFTSDIGLIKFDGSSFSLFNMPEYKCPVYLSMCIDAENTIWLGGVSDKLFKFKNNAWSTINVNNNPYYSVLNHSMAYSSDESLWISTSKRVENAEWENYLLKYDGNNYLNFTKSDLLNIGGQLVFEDATGYIITLDNLLFSYNDSIWYLYSLGNNKISSKFVKDEQGIIWEATTNGLKEYHENSVTLYTTENSNLPTNKLYEIAIHNNGNFLISNYVNYPTDTTFLFEFNFEILPRVLYQNTDKLMALLVSSIVVAENGNIWFGTRNRKIQEEGYGLYKIDDGNLVNYNINNSDLPSNAIDKVYLDDFGKIWASANCGGIVRIEENNWTVFNLFNSALTSLNNLSITSASNKIAVLSISDGITIFPHDTKPSNMVNYIEQKKNTNLLKVYPNPFSNYFNIEFSANKDQLGKIDIYNINGQQTYSQKKLFSMGRNILKLDLQSLQTGIYLGKVEFDDFTKSFKIFKVK